MKSIYVFIFSVLVVIVILNVGKWARNGTLKLACDMQHDVSIEKTY